MNERTSRRTAAAFLASAAVAVALAAPGRPASAATTITSGHWDLVAEVDCAANSIRFFAENHDTGSTASFADVTFGVTSSNSVAATSVDTGRFSSGPLRVLTHEEAQVGNGKLVVGFEVEYLNCGTATPDVTFRVVSGSVVPTGGRAAAYKNTTGTATDLDTATGTGLNGGIVTDQHEDRRWGFATTGSHGLQVRARVNPGAGFVASTQTVGFAVS